MDLTKKLIDLFPFVSESQIALLIVSFVLLIVGFWLLIKGADIFVDGASKIAEKARIPLIVIGLTIVAFGTSAPEAAISITSAATGNAGIAVGNVVGSNIFNILLILGVTALFAKLPVKRETFRYEIPFVAIISVVLLVLGVVGWGIGLVDGLILVALMVLFMIYLIKIAKNSPTEESAEPVTDKVAKLIFFIIIGLVFIVLGSDMTVYAATNIAVFCGVSNRVIGLTIVAFGTSLPELVTCISAAKKGKTDIAIGNIIGSNIFNILFVLGLSALVSPTAIEFSKEFLLDAIVCIASPIVLYLLVLKNKELRKTGGIIMLGLYILYFVQLLVV